MHHSSGSLLDVALMKKWREARLEVKMLKALGVPSTSATQLWREADFEVRMVKTPGIEGKVTAVVVRSAFRSQKCLTVSDHFL